MHKFIPTTALTLQFIKQPFRSARTFGKKHHPKGLLRYLPQTWEEVKNKSCLPVSCQTHPFIHGLQAHVGVLFALNKLSRLPSYALSIQQHPLDLNHGPSSHHTPPPSFPSEAVPTISETPTQHQLKKLLPNVYLCYYLL